MKIEKPLNKFQINFLEIAPTVARNCIAITWKSDSPLLITKWYSDMNSCVPIEQ